MKEDYSPTLHPVEIAELRPTQMTVGLREVERKRAEWRKRAERDGADFLGRHMIPAIRGPKDSLYVIDHHHLVRALHDEGVSRVLVSILADLSHLNKALFWTFMDNRNWVHPFDAAGSRRPLDQLPKKIAAMTDDPYRSLAGEVRRAGGYAKDPTPYSEFLWADFLRRRIGKKLIADRFERAVDKGVALSTSREAAYLPGWCGPSDDLRRRMWRINIAARLPFLEMTNRSRQTGSGAASSDAPLRLIDLADACAGRTHCPDCRYRVSWALRSSQYSINATHLSHLRRCRLPLRAEPLLCRCHEERKRSQ